MLPPSYFAAAGGDILDLYSQLDQTVIRDIVRRLTKTGGVTGTARLQIQALQDSGMLMDDIIKAVAGMSNASAAQVRTLLEDAGVQSTSYDDAVYQAAGLSPVPLRQSPIAVHILESNIQKTAGFLQNLTMTTASAGQQAYIQAATLAEMQVESGAFDYVTAIRNAVRTAAQDGATVLYPSGHSDHLDVAVRRAVLTGASQTAAQVSMGYADDMGCDLVETTAHPGARPSHALWQGKVFSLHGARGKYEDFRAATGYGTGPGLCGWNCRHSFFPFFEGLSPSAYPREQLKEYENRAVSYNGKELKYYDATQTQRGMESRIRATKRELAGYDEGMKSDDEAIRKAMMEDFDTTAAKLKRQEATLKDFTRQTGLDRQREREQVLGFGRSPAQKAVQAGKRIAQARQDGIIESAAKKASGMSGEFSVHPPELDLKTLSFDSAHVQARGRSVTEQEAKAFIRDAKVSVTRWKGRFVNYFSESGAAYVDVKNQIIRTSFRADEYDKKVIAMMEELKKHGK